MTAAKAPAVWLAMYAEAAGVYPPCTCLPLNARRCARAVASSSAQRGPAMAQCERCGGELRCELRVELATQLSSAFSSASPSAAATAGLCSDLRSPLLCSLSPSLNGQQHPHHHQPRNNHLRSAVVLVINAATLRSPSASARPPRARAFRVVDARADPLRPCLQAPALAMEWRSAAVHPAPVVAATMARHRRPRSCTRCSERRSLLSASLHPLADPSLPPLSCFDPTWM